jgi:hypothetical protein
VFQGRIEFGEKAPEGPGMMKEIGQWEENCGAAFGG